MTDVWGEDLVLDFEEVRNNALEQNFYGPYNKLLYKIFNRNGFSVTPQVYPVLERKERIDFFVEYRVTVHKQVVFILEVKAPGSLQFMSSREEADRQMRKRLADLTPLCPLPSLRGVSAFGTRIAYYTGNKAARRIVPQMIIGSVEEMTDVAPSTWWDSDILETNGALKFSGVLQQVLNECLELQV